MRNLDFLALGGASHDIVLRVPHLPGHDAKVVAQLVGHFGGGLVANAACAAARLGLNVAWAGHVGDDQGGRLLLDDFARFGLDTSLADVRAGATTDFCVILLDDTGERAILVVPTMDGEPPLTAERRAALGQARLVYTMPRSIRWFTDMASVTHMGGGQVMVDVEPSSPIGGDELREVLALADIVSCNRGGLALATATDEPKVGARTLLALGPRTVVVTLGAEGARAFTAGAEACVAGHRVPAVDTTGAGDCFNAAFAFAGLHDWNLGRALGFANAAAALSVQAVGARGHLPDRAQVDEFLCKHNPWQVPGAKEECDA